MLVYACNDLLFASKIASATRAAGATARPARSTAMLRARLDRVEDGKPNGPVAAVWVDLEREDALELIAMAAGRADVLAFGPHVDAGRLRAAAAAGAEAMPRGRFVAELDARAAALAAG
ncbi:hypothetical protein [Phycisphaera mikurensis]|uniref:Uncharacterized protein n=1 Tax=Phycisphaera mikurensis (strain NBRC 102666 / KCTC 22515 / FYK2301M01) TaxID=1142394 RepID=I0IDT1_PHYMF|nr:hypothetical protein [Phycisphaera mikurensis]MBB6441230.1 hypothetical protein [Phycisphaera mikurensis]BAM03419.1 hypothetical protein PSMK_12600 [Phycisphaera mikurensis NBRC 102666]